MNWFKKLARQLGQRSGERSPTPTARTTPTRLGVERMEDRLTPATVQVYIPNEPIPLGQTYNDVDIVHWPNSNEYEVGLNGRSLARGSLSGVDRLELYGSAAPEAFDVFGPGVNVTIHEASNDAIHLIGDNYDAGHSTTHVPGTSANIIVSDRWAWLSGRSVYYDGNASYIAILGGEGDDTLKAASRQVPIRVSGGRGADTIIVQEAERTGSLAGWGQTPVQAAVRIEGGGGSDRYVLGIAAPGGPGTVEEAYNNTSNLDRLKGNVVIDAAWDGDELFVFDGGDTTGNTYTVRNDLLTRSGMAARVTYGGLGRITLHAGQGDDLVQANLTSRPVTLVGNGGNDVLIGGTSDDVLVGGAGWDILVGGTGEDTLRGGDGQDILVGGSLSDSSDPTAMVTLRTNWTNTSASYSTRVAQMRSTLTSRVSDDRFRDQLWGEGDMDWFWGTWTTGSDNEVRDKIVWLSPFFASYNEEVR